ncbi:hypothetical protein RJ639_020023 [Escallonia herrerae]|uniref:RecQ-mediated genome instability protein 1 n=1 Tax=Escallonia herrerae TaxID=1293975 RepID=A0AA89AIL1_9ASTE|nr:hypothetical protein RJ639_020023 [Escallonia herrerae]
MTAKAKLCFEQFLCSDMNCVGAGVLPENVHDMHLVDLAGPFVLQVDEIVNIGCPLKGRYQNALSTLKRCLKLSMTDGVQGVFGMEYQPIKDLEVLARAGLKVAICNVNVRHGLLMLVPEVFGGLVEELEAARQRLVNEVNKPPRRKRTGVVPPLAARATLASGPPDPVSTASGVSTSDRTAEDSAVPMSRREVAEPSPSYAASSDRELDEHIQHNASSSSAVLEVDDIHMAEAVEHLSALTGDLGTPFTYFAFTYACFLTGVKGFQYKRRTTFELHVLLMTAASYPRFLLITNMFQKTYHLVLFDQGTMVIQIIEASPLPIAIEMNQGCPVTDPWLLLTRVKSYTSTQPSHSKLEPISISPELNQLTCCALYRIKKSNGR